MHIRDVSPIRRERQHPRLICPLLSTHSGRRASDAYHVPVILNDRVKGEEETPSWLKNKVTDSLSHEINIIIRRFFFLSFFFFTYAIEAMNTGAPATTFGDVFGGMRQESIVNIGFTSR